ncbi:MAG: SH3 domain-containing protein [Paracoccaceae bacterium]
MTAVSVTAILAFVPKEALAEDSAPVATVQVRTVGPVTSFPLPRFVSLKSSEGNARRGPSFKHRIDWVFSRVDMPLKITAEYGNWRRVEDSEAMGGWMYYTLLSGMRTGLITAEMADLRQQPDLRSSVVMNAGVGVVAKLTTCNLDWCKLTLEGQNAWAKKTALWGIFVDEIFD